MPSDKEHGRLVELGEEHKRLGDLASASLQRQRELFEDWQEDPLSAFKQALWEKQREDCREAIEAFEKAKTAYLEALIEFNS